MSVQQSTLLNRRRIRRTFGNINEVAQMPNLIEVQRNSYEQFLQMYDSIDERINVGLQAVFSSVFPIKDFVGRSMLEFVSYTLEEPKYDVDECHQRGLTYASPLRLTLRLIVWDLDSDTGAKSIRDMKEQDVYMGDMPLMTPNGTFVVNGTERVIVSQMHRSPGVFFDHDKGKTHASGKLLFNCRVIPNRGSWLDFEYDVKDFLYFKIDRKKKIFSSTLLLALGYSKSEIVDEFYESEQYTFDPKTEKWKTKFNPENYKAKNFSEEVVDAKTGKVIIKLGDKVNYLNAKKLANEGLKDILVSRESLFGKFLHGNLLGSFCKKLSLLKIVFRLYFL